jgi:hypothetical protein
MTDFIAPTRFCRNAEQFGDGTVAALKLHTNRPTWYLRDELPWMKRAELEAAIQTAADRWSKVCNFKAIKAANEASALWVFTVVRMDGPGGVLADAMLPNGRQQICRIDVAESALMSRLIDILGHEIGHLMGLQHFPPSPPPEWMEPTLGKVNTPQAAEAALCVQWFGEPLNDGPQTPLRPVTSGLTCVVRLNDDGKTLDCNIEASKPGFSATLAGKKTWMPAAPPQGIHQAGYPVQSIVIPPPFVEQDELADTDLEPGELR